MQAGSRAPPESCLARCGAHGSVSQIGNPIVENSVSSVPHAQGPADPFYLIIQEIAPSVQSRASVSRIRGRVRTCCRSVDQSRRVDPGCDFGHFRPLQAARSAFGDACLKLFASACSMSVTRRMENCRR